MRNLTSIILISFLFGSCEPTVRFDEPQPRESDVLNKFPKRLHGNYLNQKSNYILTITDKMLLHTYDGDIKVNKNQLDSNYKIVGDTIFDLTNNEKSYVQFDGDSIVQHFHEIDTTFIISDKNVLKKFKGYFFLNEQNSDSSWAVRKLLLSKGILNISGIKTEEEIASLREITETTSDTTSFKFKPTKRQFQKFIKQNGFMDDDYFVRLKN